VEFLAAANAYERVVRRLQNDSQAVASPNGVDGAQLDEAHERMQCGLMRISLIGGLAVMTTASGVMMDRVPALGDLETGHHAGPTGWSAVDFDDMTPGRGFPGGRKEFVSAVRRELGLRHSPWLPNSFTDVE
jgi:hypothetical protein